MSVGKLTYAEQLKDVRWYFKRNEILLRDNNKCRKCGVTNNLHVHHKEYHRRQLAWEYNNIYLITLCASCHKEIHDTTCITIHDGIVITNLLESTLIAYIKNHNLCFKTKTLNKLLSDGIIDKRSEYLATRYYLII